MIISADINCVKQFYRTATQTLSREICFLLQSAQNAVNLRS